MVYTDKGLGEMSRIFHRTYMKHLIKSPWRDVERPVLINSWEAAYFDFDDDKLVAFAHEAAKMGVDMLVMDDGSATAKTTTPLSATGMSTKRSSKAASVPSSSASTQRA